MKITMRAAVTSAVILGSISLIGTAVNCCIMMQSNKIATQTITQANTKAKSALEVAKESNEIAQEALKKSEVFFNSEHRPYLILEPVKFKDTKSYLKISRKNNEEVYIGFNYKIKNVGNKPAKDISMPPTALTGKFKEGEEVPIVTDVVGPMTLGQGEEYILSSRVTAKMNPDSIPDFIMNYDSGHGIITIQIVVFYTSELEPSKKYSTLECNRISKYRVSILKTEMD